MRCAAALATTRDSAGAVRTVLNRVTEALGGEPADLAVAFVSPHHADVLGRLGAEIRERGLVRHVLGVTAESIVGEGREVEGSAAMSLWVLRRRGCCSRPCG